MTFLIQQRLSSETFPVHYSRLGQSDYELYNMNQHVSGTCRDPTSNRSHLGPQPEWIVARIHLKADLISPGLKGTTLRLGEGKLNTLQVKRELHYEPLVLSSLTTLLQG